MNPTETREPMKQTETRTLPSSPLPISIGG